MRNHIAVGNRIEVLRNTTTGQYEIDIVRIARRTYRDFDSMLFEAFEEIDQSARRRDRLFENAAVQRLFFE